AQPEVTSARSDSEVLTPAQVDQFSRRVNDAVIRAHKTAVRLNQPFSMMVQSTLAALTTSEDIPDSGLEVTMPARLAQGFSPEIITEQCFSAPAQFAKETDAMLRMFLDAFAQSLI